MTRLLNWVIGILMLLALAALIFAVTTAHAQRPVQLWTLWETDEAGTLVRPLLRFTSLDACYAASLRHGLATGEPAICLPYWFKVV